MAVEKNFKSAKCKQISTQSDSKLPREMATRGKVMLKGNLKRKECEKQFGNHPSLKLHKLVHQGGNEVDRDKVTDAEVSDLPMRHTAATPMTPVDHALSSVSSAAGTQGSSPAKRKPGFTKIRFEDCLRCDACSCIYLDEADYHKHMRNFHQKTPKKPKSGHGKKCQSCCKNCKCSTTSSRQTCITQLEDACRLPFDIKDRWKKLMHFAEKKIDATEFPVKIKLEPEDTYDYSHLLSQVEVNIKTEPDC